ncbi:MAG: hypothetical protein PHH38_03965 [Candidatus Cloacimonetes bacterium]|nr:hypothetical protein [Candidatus Cloacimonadota bacterium]
MDWSKFFVCAVGRARVWSGKTQLATKAADHCFLGTPSPLPRGAWQPKSSATWDTVLKAEYLHASLPNNLSDSNT